MARVSIISSFVLRMLGVVLLVCFLSPSVNAQQSSQPSWQGTRPQPQPEASSADQATPVLPSLQEPLLNIPQDSSPAHPQVTEVSPPQSAPPTALQSELAGEQGQANVSQNGLLARRPAYLGITYDTFPPCRYHAGVQVTGMFEGSPAERAGIRAKGKLQWQHAVAGLLALSPAAPLAVPLIMSTAKGSGPGDIVLAVDGERVKKREEFEQIMRRFEPGDMVYLSVLRRGSTLRVPVKLGQHPSVEDPSTSLAEATTTKGKKVYLY